MRHKPEKKQENHKENARLYAAPCQKLLIPIPLSHIQSSNKQNANFPKKTIPITCHAPKKCATI
jgi:hypothetical protein